MLYCIKKVCFYAIYFVNLRNGGYPEVVASRQLTRSYLDTLFDSIIWKDVAKRHNVRNVTDLNNLAMYLVSNFCNPVSANDLTIELGFSSVNMK